MKKAICMALSAAMGCLALAACQKTPDAPIVIQKDMEQMIEKAQATPEQSRMPAQTDAPNPLAVRLGAPERYSPSIAPKSEKLTIRVDAAVHLPAASALPVAKVQPIQFSQDVVSAFFETFCGGTVMYNTSPGGFTRAGLEENILMYQNRVKEYTGSDKKNAAARLAALEAELAAMPTELSDMVCDGTLREMTFSTFKPDLGRYMGVDAVEKPFALFTESTGRGFSVRNDYIEMDWTDETIDWGEEIGASLSFSMPLGEYKGGYETAYSHIADETAVPDNAAGSLTLTPAKAREMAEAVIAKTGCGLLSDDVILMEKLYSLNESPPGESAAGASEPQPSQPPDYSYIVTFGHAVGGVPCRYVTEANANNYKTETSMAPSWFYERAEFEITDAGIQSFSWRAPMEVTEVITPGANLLPFGDIAGVFERMILVIYEGRCSESDLMSLAVEIDRAELELQRVTEQDAVNYGLVIPVWNFYGQSASQYEWGTYYDNDRQMPKSLITINAIDGSVIDVQKGY